MKKLFQANYLYREQVLQLQMTVNAADTAYSKKKNYRIKIQKPKMVEVFKGVSDVRTD
jgi:hypothetical protein